MRICDFPIKSFQMYRNDIVQLLSDTFTQNNIVSTDRATEYAEQKTKELLNFLIDGTAIMLTAFNNEKLIGFAWLYQYTFAGETRLHLTEIAVNEQYRNCGIGKNLIKYAEKKAQKLGINEIDLYTSCKNEGALHLYSQLGFYPSRIHMVKHLSMEES